MKTSLKTPPDYVAQLTTPTKDHPTNIIIMLDMHQIEERKVDNSTSPMDIESQQISKNNHYNPTLSTNYPTVNPASGLGKRSSSCVDPFATFADISSLTGYKKTETSEIHYLSPYAILLVCLD